MPGNRTDYSRPCQRLPHKDALKLWRVPDWFDIKRYDLARTWTATRWLIEIDRRRAFYPGALSGQGGLRMNSATLTEMVKGFFDAMGADSSRDEPELRLSDSYRDSLSMTLKVDDVYYCTPLEPLISTLDFTVEMAPIQGIDNAVTAILVCREGPSPVLNGAPNYSVISVDLNAPDKALEAVFSDWLEKERKSKGIKQPKIFGGLERTSKPKIKDGRPPSVGLGQRRNWARDYYLAYWDLRVLLQLAELPSPPFSNWLDLLTLSDRVRKPSMATYLATAEWLFSDEASGLLKAAAAKEDFEL